MLGKYAAQAIRPRNLRLPILIFLVTGLSSQLPWGYIIACIITIALCYGIVVTWNDTADAAIDKANNRDLPLSQGVLTKHDLRLLQILLFIAAAITLALNQSILLLVAAIIFCGIGWIYSFPPLRLSYRGLLAPLTLGLYYAVIPFQLAWLQRVPPDYVTGFLISISLVLISVAYLLYKDFKDLAGDRKFGKNTPLVLYGETTTKRLSLISAIIGLSIGCIIGHMTIPSLILGAIGLIFLVLQYRQPKPSVLLLQGFLLCSLGSIVPAISR